MVKAKLFCLYIILLFVSAGTIFYFKGISLERNIYKVGRKLGVGLETNSLSWGPDIFNKSYMISVVYNEQLTNAFIHYNEFVSLSARWNFTAVEPFVVNSRICGFQTEKTTKISQLLDMKLFQQRFAECLGSWYTSVSLINSMDLFLSESFRKVIVIYFSGHTFSLPISVHHGMDKELKNLFERNKSEQFVKCTKQAQSANLIHSVEGLLNNKINTHAFYVADVFCVPNIKISLTELMNRITNITQHKASVLFASWQGKYTRDFSDVKTMSHCVLPFINVPFSFHVNTSAAEFLKSKGFSPNEYMAVHIRFEKLFEFAYNNRKSDQNHFYECCINRARLLLKGMSNITQIPLSRTLLIHDMGEHGTDSCHFQGRWQDRKVCQDVSEQMLTLLNISPSEFKASDGTELNAGFVSLVEEASVFNGRVLLTVGQGSFQNALVRRYENYHSIRNISPAQDLHYHVCLGTEKLNGIAINHPRC